MNIKRTASKSINCDDAFVKSFSKLNIWPLKNNGNLTFSPSWRLAILSMKSISPNCQAENLSLNISRTSNSNSWIGEVKCEAVTNPTGLNLSPTLKEWPGLVILNLFISNNVDPIPTDVLDAPTSTLSNKLEPVSVVAPIPNLDTPSTARFSYVGSGIISAGLT